VQVAATTLLVFSCATLEDGSAWLTADYRQRCWNAQHKAHVGIGVVWTLLFPIGPLHAMRVLQHSAQC
jgi:hypothetical protein